MKKITALLLVAVILLPALVSCKDAGDVDGELTVRFFDVGKADFILISVGDEHMVIDSGYKSSKDRIKEAFDTLGVKKIKYAVATHSDKDHIGSMAFIIEKYNVEALYLPALESDEKLYKKMVEAAAIKGTKTVKAQRDMKFTLNGAEFTVLSPDASLLSLGSENEASTVLMMKYGQISFLFMGDAQLQAEARLMENYGDKLRCDVIKLGHHGSSKASSQLFLQKTGAKYAVISTGEDEPASEITLKALSACGIKKYDTMTDKDITVTTDGKNITVKTGGK